MRHGAGARGHTNPEQPSGGGNAELRLQGYSRVCLGNLGDNPCRSTAALKTDGQLIDVLPADLSARVDPVDPSFALIVSHAGIECWNVHATDDSESLPEKQSSSDSRVTPEVAARYHQEMDENERLREKFRTLVDQMGGRKPGIAEICKRFSEADDSISPKYLDQIYAGFQGKADHSPRTPGRALIKRLEKNLGLPPRWFYVDEKYSSTIITPQCISEQTPLPQTAHEVANVLRASVQAMLATWGVSPKDLFSSSTEAKRRVSDQITQTMQAKTDRSVATADQKIRAKEIALNASPTKKQLDSVKREI